MVGRHCAGDALILAVRHGFDVFNALDIFQNEGFLKELKFGIGEGPETLLCASFIHREKHFHSLTVLLQRIHSKGGAARRWVAAFLLDVQRMERPAGIRCNEPGSNRSDICPAGFNWGVVAEAGCRLKKYSLAGLGEHGVCEGK